MPPSIGTALALMEFISVHPSLNEENTLAHIYEGCTLHVISNGFGGDHSSSRLAITLLQHWKLCLGPWPRLSTGVGSSAVSAQAVVSPLQAHSEGTASHGRGSRLRTDTALACPPCSLTLLFGLREGAFRLPVSTELYERASATYQQLALR